MLGDESPPAHYPGSGHGNHDTGNDPGPDSDYFNRNNDPSTNAGNPFERRGIDYTAESPLFIDNKKVYYEGFKALTEEDKAKVLLGFLFDSVNAPSLDNLDDLNPTKMRERHQISRDNLQFKLKFWGSTAVIVVLIVAVLVILGLFTYFSLDKGLLDENGTLTGIMSTLKEVIGLLLSSSTPSSF